MVLAYLSLVGLPLLGVFGVLQLGKDLKVPISIGGDWRAELQEGDVTGDQCSRQGFSGTFIISVSQSGRRLALRVNDGSTYTLTGGLTGNSISAADIRSGLSVDATVDRNLEPDLMSGHLTLNCGDVRKLRFAATKQIASGEVPKGH
jgi:hypothetical protein